MASGRDDHWSKSGMSGDLLQAHRPADATHRWSAWERTAVHNSDYSAQVGTTSEDPRITLIGKPGCHLCDDARLVVERVAEDVGVGVLELSILDDPELAEQYSEQIPVVLVDGDQHDFWRVDEQRLRAALTRRRRWFGRR